MDSFDQFVERWQNNGDTMQTPESRMRSGQQQQQQLIAEQQQPPIYTAKEYDTANVLLHYSNQRLPSSVAAVAASANNSQQVFVQLKT